MENQQQAKQAFTDATSAIQEKTKKTAEQLHDRYQEAKELTNEYYEEGRDKVLHFVEQKPLASLLIAGGVGLLISLLVLNKKSD